MRSGNLRAPSAPDSRHTADSRQSRAISAVEGAFCCELKVRVREIGGKCVRTGEGLRVLGEGEDRVNEGKFVIMSLVRFHVKFIQVNLGYF